LVTVTVGGNDLMGAYGDTQAARAAIGRVRAVGEAIMVRLAELCGDGGRIVLTTVYDPSDGTGEVANSGPGPWPDAPALVQELNAARSPRRAARILLARRWPEPSRSTVTQFLDTYLHLTA
jgi:hypothetical protein